MILKEDISAQPNLPDLCVETLPLYDKNSKSMHNVY